MKSKNVIAMMFGLSSLIILGILIIAGIFIGIGFLTPEPDSIAVIEINGEITTLETDNSLFSSGVIGSEQIAKSIRNLNNKDNVKAVVFVINSPGGSAVATGEIYNAVKELNKPKVAYFREMAASGGYYVAAPMDYIVANPQSLTGSISAIMTHVDLSQLFGMVGYNQTNIKSGDLKDIGSPNHALTIQEEEILQNIVDQSFDDFKFAVMDGRKSKLDLSRSDEIFDGRVITGKDAVGYGLVDQTGTKEDAINKAIELAGVEREDIIIETIDIGNEDIGLLFNKMSYSLGYGFGNGIISEQGISQSPSLSYR